MKIHTMARIVKKQKNFIFSLLVTKKKLLKKFYLSYIIII